MEANKSDSLSPEKIALIEQFDVEKQFDLFLKRMELDRRKMPPYQITEMKRAFYGAWGQLIILLSAEVTVHLTQDELAALYQAMAKQVMDFMSKETIDQTRGN